MCRLIRSIGGWGRKGISADRGRGVGKNRQFRLPAGSTTTGVARRGAARGEGAAGRAPTRRAPGGRGRIELERQTLVLGAVDARNPKLETADEIARLVQAAARRVDISRIWLAPTTSLEYLPHDIARAKLRVLVEGARTALAAGGVR